MKKTIDAILEGLNSDKEMHINETILPNVVFDNMDKDLRDALKKRSDVDFRRSQFKVLKSYNDIPKDRGAYIFTDKGEVYQSAGSSCKKIEYGRRPIDIPVSKLKEVIKKDTCYYVPLMTERGVEDKNTKLSYLGKLRETEIYRKLENIGYDSGYAIDEIKAYSDGKRYVNLVYIAAVRDKSIPTSRVFYNESTGWKFEMANASVDINGLKSISTLIQRTSEMMTKLEKFDWSEFPVIY